jgi:ABC-type sugar transport system substrate-binding protein
MKQVSLIAKLVALVGVAAACVLFAARHLDAPPAESSSQTAARTHAASAPSVPEFRQPQQAAAYREAMTEGNQRALQVLNQALTQARAQPNADAKQIAALEQEIDRRRKLLEEVAAVR